VEARRTESREQQLDFSLNKTGLELGRAEAGQSLQEKYQKWESLDICHRHIQCDLFE